MTHLLLATRPGRPGTPWLRATLVALTLPTAALAVLTVGPAAPARADVVPPVDNPANPGATSCVADGTDLHCTVKYTYTGGEQQFVAPQGVSSVDVVAVGGDGARWSDVTTAGRGAVASGRLSVTGGQTSYVEVGQPGQRAVKKGAFNGGGEAYDVYTAGGGGGTDLRSASRTDAGSLDSRLLVAGGGGGADTYGSGGDAGLDGSAGTTNSPSISSPGQGGTQSAGGAGGTGPLEYTPRYYVNFGAPGSAGQGGFGGASGGGGYFGGGGGNGYAGGGGGSSLVPTGGSVRVNDTGLAPQLTVSYTLPATGVVLLGNDTARAGEVVSYSTSYTDGTHQAATGEAQRLSISPNGGHTGAACTDTGCSATKPGDYTVKTRVGSFSDVTTLTVTPGPVASLALSPATVAVAAGGSQAYTATGADEFGNEVGDVTSDATFSYARDGGDPQPCDESDGAPTCAPAHGGHYQVTASLTPSRAPSPVLGHATLDVGLQPTVASVSVGTSTFGGDAPAASATLGVKDGSAPSGSVGLSLDQADAHSAPIGDDGSVSVPSTLLQGLHAGVHTLTLTYAGDDDHAASSDTASFLVKQAKTTTTVASHPGSLSATVTGADPTGDVTFYVDGAKAGTGTLDEDGAATWEGDSTTARDAVVAAVYEGDDDHQGSAGSTARRNPTITATPSATGWTKDDVTITFSCTGLGEGDACPDPVVVTNEGVTQPDPQTVVSDDGGVATVTPAPVRIDRTAPVAQVTGPAGGGLYLGDAPDAGCAGTDTGSGIASCTVRTVGTFGTVRSTATATDAAGNTATTTVTYGVRDVWVDGAVGQGGSWKVKRGTTALLHVVHDGKMTVIAPNGTKKAGHLAGQLGNVRHWTQTVSASTRKGTVRSYTFKFSDGTTKVVRIIAS